MADITMTDTMSPKLLKVMERAKRDPQARLRGLARFIDEAALTRAFDALGVDSALGGVEVADVAECVGLVGHVTRLPHPLFRYETVMG
ncbi:MAG: hypothetical protein QNK18_09190 [Gammaproteobacteria bacterium]|nr:hypothetical protein [Gammaproteobacteria bacterium]